jgi:hypothetical protein
MSYPILSFGVGVSESPGEAVGDPPGSVGDPPGSVGVRVRPGPGVGVSDGGGVSVGVSGGPVGVSSPACSPPVLRHPANAANPPAALARKVRRLMSDSCTWSGK